MIYIIKSQSFIRTPLVSLIVEGEDWLVGFDEVFESMPDGSLIDFEGSSKGPSARVIAHNRHKFQIEIDLKEFAAAKPRIGINDGFLVITANKTEYAKEENHNYLQRGISAQGFRRSFQLGRNTRVTDSNLHHGILQIEIEQADPSYVEPVKSWTRAG